MRPVPWSVLVVPIAWTIVASSAALAFGVVEDVALPIAAVCTLVVLHRRVTRARSSATPRPPLQLGF